MESTNNTSPLLLPTDNTPNPRKPNLPAKFQKFLAFAFFFSNLLKEHNLINDDNFYKALSLFNAFDSIDSQTSFFKSFELQFKPILKSFKLLLKEREKANKPKKTKKTNKKNTTATATTDEPLVSNEETAEQIEKPKKQRKSKKNTEVTTTNNEETSEDTEKPKKPRKSKKNTASVEETPTNNEETSDTAEKPKKQRKSKKEKKGSQDTEEKSDLIHELLTLANSEPDEV